MLVPIPGFAHLLYLVPDPLPQAIHARTEVPREVSVLVRVALDSAGRGRGRLEFRAGGSVVGGAVAGRWASVDPIHWVAGVGI